MQRLSALVSWDRSKTSNTGAAKKKIPEPLDKVNGWAGGLTPINTATPTRYGRETYWPTTLDKECEKAARILKSFCIDGFLAQDRNAKGLIGPEPQAHVAKIPPRILQDALGLAVFSCMRSGLWMSGSGGAGLITARKADGTWSPPSGIILHTAAMGFATGVDIYDCILVINSVQTLEMFTRPRLTLGSDVNLCVGPLVRSGTSDKDMRWKELNETVLTYVKARGKIEAVQLVGSMVTERGNENGRFYGSPVTVLDVLAGNMSKSIPEMRPLFEVIKAAEGRSDYDEGLMNWLAQQPAPGDAFIETPLGSPLLLSPPPRTPFGVPDSEDPDPFGVISLEMAGIEIREAGSRDRPTSHQFEFSPSPSSPLFGRFSRQSLDAFLTKNKRGSFMSSRTLGTVMTDAHTQTDVGASDTTISTANSDDGLESVPGKQMASVGEAEEVDYTKIDRSVIEQFTRPRTSTIESIPEDRPLASLQRKLPQVVVREDGSSMDENDSTDGSICETTGITEEEVDADADDEDEEEEEDDEDDEEEPIICEVATAASPSRVAIMSTHITQVIHAKGALVTIPKRIPPVLPQRSPARNVGSKSERDDIPTLRTPLRTAFILGDLAAEESSAVGESQVGTSISWEDANAVRTWTESEVESCRLHVMAKEAVDRMRWSLGSSPIAPSSPQTFDMVSSADDSDREPRTPEAENVVMASVKALMVDVDDSRIMAHSESSPVAFA